MIKEHFRYRNFMIVFEDDRYYICKASSFSKNGNNRYNWKDISTIDEAKKIIDKYWEDENKEVNESMIKNRARGRKIESKDEDLEVLNEYEDEDEELEEVTNPSNIGSFKRSSIVNRARKSKKKDEEVCNEDRIVTKDDELNKPTNVKDDDTGDKIDVNISTSSNDTDSTSDDNSTEEQQKDEVILKEDEMSVDDKKKWLESASNEDLLKQYVSFINQNRFGSTYEDIKLTEEEILKRMNK